MAVGGGLRLQLGFGMLFMDGPRSQAKFYAFIPQIKINFFTK